MIRRIKWNFSQDWGALGTIIVLFWVIVSFLIPFMIWGIHSKSHQAANDLAAIKKLLQGMAGEPVDKLADDGLLRDL